MVTGSMATSYYGRPRATHDADVVIDPTPDQLETMLAQLEAARFYVPAGAARDALRHRGQFNAIESTRATKVDLIIRKARAFSEEEFSRRRRVDLAFGARVSVVTPEDAILSKLEWARLAGDSERQLRDAAGVLEVTPDLDQAYIDRWADRLGVADSWEQITRGRS
jgi:hypothetical protein